MIILIRPSSAIVFLSCAFALLLSANIGYAAGSHSSFVGSYQPRVMRDKGTAPTPEHHKLSHHLRTTLSRLEARGLSRANIADYGVSSMAMPLLRIKDSGAIQVYIYVTDEIDDVLEALGRMEAQVELYSKKRGIIQVWLPFDRMQEVAALSMVKRIAPPVYTTPRAGSVTTEGDAIHLADALRAMGFAGRNTKVGVISVGAEKRDIAVASGDLPPNITVFGNCDPYFGIGCFEGTALMEIIHDLAPEAELGFGAAGTSLEFEQRLSDLVHTFGANIVIDDLGCYSEPYFADGPLAQAVQANATQVVYISAAGNDAQGHYEADFVPMSMVDGIVHDFGVADGNTSASTMTIEIPPGSTVVVYLQWNDPFGGSSNDYDLYLLDSSGTEILCDTCASSGFQTGTEDPIEAIYYKNASGMTVFARLAVVRYEGANRRIEMYFKASPGVKLEYNVPADSIFGHAAVYGVLTAAAVHAATPDAIASFSSRGPSTVYFPSFQQRAKPEISGVDGVTISEASGLPSPFYGTSASAPHIAGIAALLLNMDPTATPLEIRNAIKAGAVDLGPPGIDMTFGAGRADALASSKIMVVLVSATLPNSRSGQVGDTVTAFATTINAGTETATECSIAALTPIPADLVYQTTDPATNALTGTPNTPVDIAAGKFQTYVIALTFTGAFVPTDVQLKFDCTNTAPAETLVGLNTLLLSASDVPVPDIVALAATLRNDGIVHVPGEGGTGVFSVATANLGAGDQIKVTADTGGVQLPGEILVCRTDSQGQCFAPPVDATSGISSFIDQGGTPTFAFFVKGEGTIPPDPANHRVFVRFKDSTDVTRGATSVACQTN